MTTNISLSERGLQAPLRISATVACQGSDGGLVCLTPQHQQHVLSDTSNLGGGETSWAEERFSP